MADDVLGRAQEKLVANFGAPARDGAPHTAARGSMLKNGLEPLLDSLPPRKSPLRRAAGGSSADLTPTSSRFDLGASLLGEPAAPSLSSNAATFVNLINNYVGMVLLSMHFCFARCGWLALPALALLTAYGAFTGDCLVEAYKLIEKDDACARPPSYAEIGERCLGAFGRWLVVVSASVENFFAILCMDIIIWANAELLLPRVPTGWVIGGCILLSLPTNLLRDFSLLSRLSAFSLFCIGLILAVVAFDVANAALDPAEGSAAPPASRTLADLSGLPMSSSIMLAGLTGHVGLPPMYAEMKTRSAFRPVLYASFLAMFGMYAAVGIGGYLLFGADASVLITQVRGGMGMLCASGACCAWVGCCAHAVRVLCVRCACVRACVRARVRA